MISREELLEEEKNKKFYFGKNKAIKHYEKLIEKSKEMVASSKKELNEVRKGAGFERGKGLDRRIEQEEELIRQMEGSLQHWIDTGAAVEGMSLTQEELNENLKIHRENLKKMTEEYENMEAVADKAAKAMFSVESIDQFSNAFKSALSDMPIDFLSTMEDMQSIHSEHLDLFGDKNEAMGAAITEASMQVGAAMVDMHLQQVEANMNAIKEQGKAELEQEKKTRKWQKMSENQKQKREKEILADTQAKLNKEFESKQDAARVGVLMDTATAVMKAMAGSTFTAGQPWASIAIAMGAAQLALINSQKPPKAATGGLIGGNLHSQGGTIIEAERGEFVMNRDAVDSVGVETMNRINMGGGAGGVNVSFSGNINSDDFIESEAIPKIKEAIRRGADIGVS